MTGEDITISESELHAVADLLEAAWHYGIGVTFVPDGQGWTIGTMQGITVADDLVSNDDLETAARVAERLLDHIAQRLAGNERS